jgi:hypothetical protein
VCTNTGMIPPKALREAVLYLTGITQRELYSVSYRVKENIILSDLLARTQIFLAAKGSRSTRCPYRPGTTYLDRAQMAQEMERRTRVCLKPGKLVSRRAQWHYYHRRL